MKLLKKKTGARKGHEGGGGNGHGYALTLPRLL